MEPLLFREASRDLFLNILFFRELFLAGSRSRETPGELGVFLRTCLLGSRVGVRTRERERDLELSREFVCDSREAKRPSSDRSGLWEAWRVGLVMTRSLVVFQCFRRRLEDEPLESV